MIETMPSDTILNHSASHWGLSNLVFIRKMENIVYSAERNGEKVFLRLTSPLRRGRFEIEAELNWIEHLAKSDLPVPKIIQNKNGHKIASLTHQKEHFEAVVFAEVKGAHPSKEQASTPLFLQKLGALIAKMHNASEQHVKDAREEWYDERGIRHALIACKKTALTDLKEKFNTRITWLKCLPSTEKTYGLIHADLGALNLFLGDDDSISIIDFDDSCYHFFAFDLAIVIYSMAGKFHHATPQPIEQTWLNELLNGYKSVRNISDVEISWIPKLMEFATLRLIFWIEHHETLGTFHIDAIERIKEMKEWAIGRLK